MDRIIVYPNEVPQDTDLLNTNRFAMVGLGMALQALLGSGTYVDGLACAPVAGTMQVQIGEGAIYSLAAVDATAYGSLSADTADQIVQQGLTFGQTTFTLTAPATAGQSQIYLVEAQFQQVDADPVALEYYDSVTQQAFYGTPTNTLRKGVCALQARAGAPAATGSQVAPSADAGWTPLWTVTVANGQTAIVQGNIATASGAPFITAKLGGNWIPWGGNPNGQVAGVAAVAGLQFPSVVFDFATPAVWICTTSGTVATAVWTQFGASGPPSTMPILFTLKGANLNSTADQPFVARGILPSKFIITGIYCTNASGAPSAAVGGIYTGPGKTGTPIIYSGQSYSGLTSPTAMRALGFDAGSAEQTYTSAPYLSLTTPQGSAMTADFYIAGIGLP